MQLLLKDVLQTGLGMGMGTNGTAQFSPRALGNEVRAGLRERQAGQARYGRDGREGGRPERETPAPAIIFNNCNSDVLNAKTS